MRKTEVEGIVETLRRARTSRTHRGFRYLTEVRKTVEHLRLMVASHLPTHLTKQLNYLGRVQVMI